MQLPHGRPTYCTAMLCERSQGLPAIGTSTHLVTDVPTPAGPVDPRAR